MEEKQVLIICGEPSGELHASNLAREIKRINPAVKISAVGGALLKEAGASIIYDIKGLSAFGFFDVLKKLPVFFGLKKFLLSYIEKNRPDLIVLVDFGGFNLRLAKALKNKVPVAYYICPQVWASRPGRVKTIRKYITRALVIFPFEKDFYAAHGVDAQFIGHPLLDIVKPSMAKEDFLRQNSLGINNLTIALLPGSRNAEIRNILPLMAEAASLISKKINAVQFIIAKTKGVSEKEYTAALKGRLEGAKIIESKTYDCLNSADFALVASGTATLETALIGKPFSVIYKMGLLNYLLYRPQVKVPFASIVNILAERKIVEEFIQFDARPKKIAGYVIDTIADAQKLKTIKENLSLVVHSLGEPGAAFRAARLLLS